jgi:hypothetical protein
MEKRGKQQDGTARTCCFFAVEHLVNDSDLPAPRVPAHFDP